jgi:hypothetical protein
MTPALIDRIYECSFLPELWPSVLADLAEIGDARGGVLAVMNAKAGIMRWAPRRASSPRWPPSFPAGGLCGAGATRRSPEPITRAS